MVFGFYSNTKRIMLLEKGTTGDPHYDGIGFTTHSIETLDNAIDRSDMDVQLNDGDSWSTTFDDPVNEHCSHDYFITDSEFTIVKTNDTTDPDASVSLIIRMGQTGEIDNVYGHEYLTIEFPLNIDEVTLNSGVSVAPRNYNYGGTNTLKIISQGETTTLKSVRVTFSYQKKESIITCDNNLRFDISGDDGLYINTTGDNSRISVNAENIITQQPTTIQICNNSTESLIVQNVLNYDKYLTVNTHGESKGVSIHQPTHILDTSESIDQNTGSLIVDGGIGVVGEMYTGKINVIDDTDATNATTGSLVLNGGLGVAQHSYFGKSIYQKVVNVPDASYYVTLDLSQGNMFHVSVTGTLMMTVPSNMVVGQSGLIILFRNNALNTVSFLSGWYFQNSLLTDGSLVTNTNNNFDIVRYYVYSSDIIFGFYQDNFVNSG